MTLKTKKNLLEKSMSVFAQKGYAEASVRDIADAANVNVSAIKYYFGNKRGLYEAVLNLFVRFVRAEISTVFERAKSLSAQNAMNADNASDCLCDLFSRLVRLLCSKKIPSDAVTIFLSEYAHTSASYKVIEKGLISPVNDLTAGLIVAATQGKLTLQEAYLHSFPLLTQLFVFKSHEKGVRYAAGWKRYGEKEIDVITELCLRHTRAVIHDLAK